MLICRWKKAVEAVHRAKIALMLADFAGIHSAVPSIVARYKVSTFMYSLVSYVWVQKLHLPDRSIAPCKSPAREIVQA